MKLIEATKREGKEGISYFYADWASSTSVYVKVDVIICKV